MYSKEMKFVETHEWVKLEHDDEVQVGITDHAQGLLGDLVYVELPKVGQQVKAGDPIGVIESVKAASDIYSPVTGEVIEVNDEVISDPTLVNAKPHTAGWLFRVRLNNLDELEGMLNVNKYQALIGK